MINIFLYFVIFDYNNLINIKLLIFWPIWIIIFFYITIIVFIIVFINFNIEYNDWININCDKTFVNKKK